MNYLKEILAFHNRLVGYPMHAGLQALWHTLLYYNNRFGWAETFSVSTQVLMSDLQLSRKEVNRLRNLLVEKGLLQYQSGQGSRSGTYRLIPIAEQNAGYGVSQPVPCEVPYDGSQTESPIKKNKQNKMKQKQTKEQDPLTQFAEVIDPHSFSEEVRHEIGEYLKMRCEKKKTPTVYALKLVLEKLAEASEKDRLEMLRASIRNCWTDVYEPKKSATQDANERDYTITGWDA